MREFPGSPLLRIPQFHCQKPGFNPGWRTNILQDSWQSQKKLKIENKFKKHQKINVNPKTKIKQEFDSTSELQFNFFVTHNQDLKAGNV